MVSPNNVGVTTQNPTGSQRKIAKINTAFTKSHFTYTGGMQVPFGASRMVWPTTEPEDTSSAKSPTLEAAIKN